MKIIDTIARLLFSRQLDAARREGRADAHRTMENWTQTVANARQQESSRQVYLEKESNALREMANDLARAVLRYKGHITTNDESYPDDRRLGFDGYGTTLALVAAEQTLKSRGGQPRRSAWREKAGIGSQTAEEARQRAVAADPGLTQPLDNILHDEVARESRDQRSAG